VTNAPHLVVLGIAQDGGHPQAGCWRPCCAPAWEDRRLGHLPACLGLIDPSTGGRWLLDATPAISEQIARLGPPQSGKQAIDGVVVTHAHLGHVLGVLHLGREALGADSLPVYGLPRLRRMLSENLPWSLLAEHGHCTWEALEDEPTLGPFAVRSIRVPHRGEASETAAVFAKGPNKTALYLPDIDRWHGWTTDVAELVAQVDFAFLDATFFDDREIGWRDPATIPHPRVRDTMDRLQHLPDAERAKVRFLHFNHTNPMLDRNSAETQEVLARGYGIAREGDVIEL